MEACACQEVCKLLLLHAALSVSKTAQGVCASARIRSSVSLSLQGCPHTPGLAWVGPLGPGLIQEACLEDAHALELLQTLPKDGFAILLPF